MGTVKIIGQNSGLTIRMDCRQWQDQAVELEAKLRLLKTRDGHPAEVFFDSDPGAERLKQLFEILQATGCVCRGLYIQKKPEVPGNLTVIREPLRAGELIQLEGAAVLLHDVRQPIQIEMRGSGPLIVLGTVAGQIRLLDPACQLIAMGLDHARVKISDSDWQILTNFAKVCVYYENQRCTSLCLKEEEVWQG